VTGTLLPDPAAVPQKKRGAIPPLPTPRRAWRHWPLLLLPVSTAVRDDFEQLTSLSPSRCRPRFRGGRAAGFGRDPDTRRRASPPGIVRKERKWPRRRGRNRRNGTGRRLLPRREALPGEWPRPPGAEGHRC
jgi:hypothetical protein